VARLRALAPGLVAFLLTAPAAGDPGVVDLAVLSYNVHGLASWAAGDAPEARMPRIGRLLNAYDVALLQEDWVHHEGLRREAQHPFVERGQPARESWFRGLAGAPAESGSGLTLLARLPRDRIALIEREPYGLCAGWVVGGADCFADKGWLRARLALAAEFEVDFWDTHLDAGDGASDLAARRAQLEILRERIGSRSRERAVFLGGDFNLDFADPEERALLGGFAASLGLADAGIEPGPPWKRIDYLFYRGGDGVAVELVEAGREPTFVHDGGAPLSDHPAVYARFRLRRVAPGSQ
jgi:endonuclease/exonuclease/phosphatase family metal-dependent hydrolase